MKLSIIIPVYNEKKTFGKLLQSVLDVRIAGVDKEIIVVDDGSEQNPKSEIRNPKSNEIVFIRHERNLGKGAAVKTGLKAASGDYVLIQDADLEYNPSDYPLLLGPILKGEIEVVFGSRFLRKNKRNYFYALGNVLATRLFNLLFDTRLTDLATCYKLFPSKIKEQLLAIKSNDFVFDVVDLTYVIAKNGFRIKEVPISYEPRGYKEKKLKIKHGVKIFWGIFRLALK